MQNGPLPPPRTGTAHTRSYSAAVARTPKSGPQRTDPLGDVEPETVRKLLTAALAAFAEEGYHATTTRTISTRAGLSSAALYVHFSSKSEVLARLCELGHRHVLAEVEAAVAAADDPPAQVDAFVRRFGEWHAVNHTLARVVQYELRSLDPDQLKPIATIRQGFGRILRRVLKSGVAGGDFEVDDPSGTALTILSIGIDVARWYEPGKSRSPARIGATQANLVARMLAPAS